MDSSHLARNRLPTWPGTTVGSPLPMTGRSHASRDRPVTDLPRRAQKRPAGMVTRARSAGRIERMIGNLAEEEYAHPVARAVAGIYCCFRGWVNGVGLVVWGLRFPRRVCPRQAVGLP